MPPPSFKALVLLTALCAGPAHALTVEVAAPDALKALLMQHLETARAARLGDKLDAEEMARLQRQSDQTARDLLATEGYFSPQVESAVEWLNGDWRVDYRILPGVRTQVRSVTLVFDGALKADADKAQLRERIVSSFSLKQSMPFRQADWDTAKLVVLRPLLVDTNDATLDREFSGLRSINTGYDDYVLYRIGAPG